jgi:SAM-dependent methyltransferase
MLVCPDCKTTLETRVLSEVASARPIFEKLFCRRCQREYDTVDQIPVLLSVDARYNQASKIGSVYDSVYTDSSRVWEDQGRTPEFLSYFAGLAGKLSTGKVLEIGCGEGFLLSRIRANEIAAIDLSSQALRKARERVSAVCCVALAERLPFADGSFDLVVAVGVMEHFLNDREATNEIRRVLRPGGHYLTLIHVHMSTAETIRQKIREYIYPRVRPSALAKWIAKKVVRPISQPIQRPYSRHTAQLCLEQCGLVIKDVISTRTHAESPFIGPHVVAFVARKP